MSVNLETELERLKNDYKAFRTRAAREIKESYEKGIAEASTELFALVDGCDRAIEMLDEEHKDVIQGLQLLRQQAISSFESLGFQTEYPIGEFINPKYHQILAMEDGDKPTGTVVKVIKRGWRIDERLVVAAQVVVCRGAEPMPKNFSDEIPKENPLIIEAASSKYSNKRRSGGRFRPAPGWTFGGINAAS